MTASETISVSMGCLGALGLAAAIGAVVGKSTTVTPTFVGYGSFQKTDVQPISARIIDEKTETIVSSSRRDGDQWIDEPENIGKPSDWPIKVSNQ